MKNLFAAVVAMLRRSPPERAEPIAASGIPLSASRPGSMCWPADVFPGTFPPKDGER